MNHRRFSVFSLAILLLLCSLASQGDDFLTQPKSTTFDSSLLAPDDDFLPVAEAFQLDPRIAGQNLILRWDVAPGYYLYQERFVFRSNRTLALDPIFAEGITKYDEFFSKDMTVFYGNATVTLPLPPDASPFILTIQSQGCADAGLCYPPYTQAVAVNPAEQTAAVVPVPADDVSATDPAPSVPQGQSLWLFNAILLAIAGGFILNLMPCVFPVLSIKVMSLAQADRDRLPLHGWVYTAGIVLSFLLFAIILLVARAGGEAIGWGFQLQSPLLITALIYLFFIMGLGLSGVINIGSRWMGAGQQLTQQRGLKGSFFTGVLAAVVASPCTAPFMGAALGFALTQPGPVSLSVFAALGFGMALPLLLLCYLPALAQRLPRPGPWMETFKEILAFPMYLTAIWLLWVLGRQAGVDVLILVCVGALAIAFGFWVLTRNTKGLRLQWLVALLAWGLAVFMPWQALSKETEISRWQAYSPELLSRLRAEGKPVFVNLTADWCLTCLANERIALNTDEVNAAFERNGVVTLKGDWTNTDPQITELLNAYGRSGVPLYLWFPANHQGPAQVLPQLLTRGLVVAALDGDNP